MITSETGITIADSAELTKAHIREKVWSYMTENNIARYPMPITNRIPNFQGGGQCGNKLSQLPEFVSANTVKVNPDKAQEEVRFWTLALRKKLLVPSPRLIGSLFNLLENNSNDDTNSLRRKAQSEGIKNLSVPISLDDKIHVDLIVIGSVAVSKKGRRIGKGEGFADFEYAMMKSMGAIDNNVLVITTVHDCQVFDDLPSKLFEKYDVPIDIIVTPTKIIHIDHALEKPDGIYWHLITREKFRQIPILRVMYEMEKEKNIDVTLMNGYEPADEEEDCHDESEEPTPRESNRFVSRRGKRGRVIRKRGDMEPSSEYNQSSRDFNRAPYRGRGRGRGWNRRTEDEQPLDEATFKDKKNIQITINVDKRNHIIRREVEETNQQDRVGNADQDEEELSALPPSANRKNETGFARPKNDFAIYVGGIPRICRFSDLKRELLKRNVKPNFIAWKMNGFAFLNFYKNKVTAEEVMESLKGLSIKQKELKLGIAPTNKHDGKSKFERQSHRTGKNEEPPEENVDIKNDQDSDDGWPDLECEPEPSPENTRSNPHTNSEFDKDNRNELEKSPEKSPEILNQISKITTISESDSKKLDKKSFAGKYEQSHETSKRKAHKICTNSESETSKDQASEIFTNTKSDNKNSDKTEQSPKLSKDHASAISPDSESGIKNHDKSGLDKITEQYFDSKDQASAISPDSDSGVKNHDKSEFDKITEQYPDSRDQASAISPDSDSGVKNHDKSELDKMTEHYPDSKDQTTAISPDSESGVKNHDKSELDKITEQYPDSNDQTTAISPDSNDQTTAISPDSESGVKNHDKSELDKITEHYPDSKDQASAISPDSDSGVKNHDKSELDKITEQYPDSKDQASANSPNFESSDKNFDKSDERITEKSAETSKDQTSEISSSQTPDPCNVKDLEISNNQSPKTAKGQISELPISQPPKTSAPAELSISQPPKSSEPEELSINQPPKASEPEELSINQPPKASEPEELSINQPPKASEPEELSINQPPKASEPEKLSINQPPKTSEPAELSINQPPNTSEPAELSINQPPKTSEPELSINQPPKTSEPAELSINQPPKTSEPELSINQPPKISEPAELSINQPPKTSEPAELSINQPPKASEPEESNTSTVERGDERCSNNDAEDKELV